MVTSMTTSARTAPHSAKSTGHSRHLLTELNVADDGRIVLPIERVIAADVLLRPGAKAASADCDYPGPLGTASERAAARFAEVTGHVGHARLRLRPAPGVTTPDRIEAAVCATLEALSRVAEVTLAPAVKAGIIADIVEQPRGLAWAGAGVLSRDGKFSRAPEGRVYYVMLSDGTDPGHLRTPGEAETLTQWLAALDPETEAGPLREAVDACLEPGEVACTFGRAGTVVAVIDQQPGALSHAQSLSHRLRHALTGRFDDLRVQMALSSAVS